MNYGEGAWLKAPETGDRWVTLPGNQVYHDAATGIWYCYAQGMWHYSVDTCQTWVDVPMLDIRVVEGTGTVDTYDWKLWTHHHGAMLEFFDSRYAQSGWHNMTNEFVVEYYDGVGYDGEPLKVVDVAITDEQSDSTVWLNNLTPTGATPESPSPDATITEWDTYVYGQWDNKLVASWIVPKPSAEYNAWTIAAASGVNKLSADDGIRAAAGTSGYDKPLTVMFMCEDDVFTKGANVPPDISPEQLKKCEELYVQYIKSCMGFDGFYVPCTKNKFSLDQMVTVLQAMTQDYKQPVQNLLMMQHGNPGVLRIGTDEITPFNFCAYKSAIGQTLATDEYADGFKKIGEVMTANWYGREYSNDPETAANKAAEYKAQIQLYECQLAGYNPFLGTDNEDKKRSTGARAMLTSIAEFASATVFASSDSTIIDAEPGRKPLEVFAVDTCLEFGVTSGGKPVLAEDLVPCMWDVNTGIAWQTFDVSRPYDVAPNAPTTAAAEKGATPTDYTWLSMLDLANDIRQLWRIPR